MAGIRRSSLAALLTLSLALVAGRADALGAICGGGAPSAKKARESAAVIFLGVVEKNVELTDSVQRLGRWSVRHIVTLKVKKMWKGVPQDSVVINTGDWYLECGIKFQPGALCLVYGMKERITWAGKTEELLTDSTSGRRSAPDFPQADFAELGKPTYARE